MKKRLLFVADPLNSLNVKTDTTLALIEEFTARGYENYACEIADIVVKEGKAHFWSARVSLPRNYLVSAEHEDQHMLRSADDFVAIFMRKDPPVDDKFLSALLMLRHHDPKKTLMVNHPDGLLLANEKLFGLKIAAHHFPLTLVSSNKFLLMDFIHSQDRVVLKPLYGAGGASILVFDRSDRNISSALELLTHSFSRPIMVQAYVPEARLGDKRIIVLGGKAVGAILRVPSDDDHRANLHVGGNARATTITKKEEEIVEHLAPHLKQYGLHLVGIDVLGDYLTEINVTSPTGVIEIENYSPAKPLLRAQIADHVERLLA